MKKEYLFLILGISLILIALVIILVDNKSTRFQTTQSENNTKNSSYICRSQIDDGDNYTTYLVETIKVEDGRVISSTPTIELLCKDKEKFDDLKNNEDFKINKTFDDDNLKITYSNGDEISYLKDINGEELNLDYKTYKDSLEKAGYLCN